MPRPKNDPAVSKKERALRIRAMRIAAMLPQDPDEAQHVLGYVLQLIEQLADDQESMAAKD